MHLRVAVVSLALAAPAAAPADTPVRIDAFTWNCGSAACCAPAPEGAPDVEPREGGELHRAVEDAHLEARARQELRRIQSDPRDAEPRIDAWELRQERRLRAADLQQDLDRDDGGLDRAIDRARQRVEIRREAARARREALPDPRRALDAGYRGYRPIARPSLRWSDAPQ